MNVPVRIRNLLLFANTWDTKLPGWKKEPCSLLTNFEHFSLFLFNIQLSKAFDYLIEVHSRNAIDKPVRINRDCHLFRK